eukprot:1437828-Amphidinium_carterae.1
MQIENPIWIHWSSASAEKSSKERNHEAKLESYDSLVVAWEACLAIRAQCEAQQSASDLKYAPPAPTMAFRVLQHWLVMIHEGVLGAPGGAFAVGLLNKLQRHFRSTVILLFMNESTNFTPSPTIVSPFVFSSLFSGRSKFGVQIVPILCVCALFSYRLQFCQNCVNAYGHDMAETLMR